MRVFVYFNLHKKCWSVKALEGPEKGRVVIHADSVLLSDVRPKVSQAGRERVIRERKKNVHAGIVGHLSGYLRHGQQSAPLHVPENSTEITYNPYKFTTFVRKSDEVEFLSGAWALLQDKRVHVAGTRLWGW